MKGILVFIVILQIQNYGFAYEKCLRPPATHIIDGFLTREPFHIIAHSLCNNCEEDDKAFQYHIPTTMKKIYCWKIQGKIPRGRFQCELECRYNSKSEQVCNQVAPATGPTLRGSVIITQTDNSTYIAASVCRFGKENFWFVAVPQSVRSLPFKTTDKIYEELRSQGFKTEEDDQVDVVFTGFQILDSNC